IYRAGTLILASMILVWALLYFPSRDYPERIDAAEKVAENEETSEAERTTASDEARRLQAEWKEQSALGWLGHAVEPSVRPLGWDWRIGVAALASFPAREVVVGTLGILYQAGKVEGDDIRDADRDELSKHDLVRVLRGSVLRPASALSLMVFFALC